MKSVATLVTVCVLSLLVGCAPTEKGRKAMVKPVNCATAKQDIQTLEKTKASTGQAMAAGAKTFVPVGMVVSILAGTYEEGIEVAGGKYNKDIEAKIAEIKKVCVL